MRVRLKLRFEAVKGCFLSLQQAFRSLSGIPQQMPDSTDVLNMPDFVRKMAKRTLSTPNILRRDWLFDPFLICIPDKDGIYCAHLSEGVAVPTCIEDLARILTWPESVHGRPTSHHEGWLVRRSCGMLSGCCSSCSNEPLLQNLQPLLVWVSP